MPPGHARHVLIWLCVVLGLVMAGAARAEAGEGAEQLEVPVGADADEAEQGDSDSPYLSDWFHQQVQFIGSTDIRFGPRPVDDIYLEYEFFGTKGPFDIYGYIDFNKIFGVGSDFNNGVWDADGSPFFTELQPRMSLDRLFGRDFGFGPIKEWFVATDYILDVGHNRSSRQNTFYVGPGAAIDTHSPVNLEVNFFFRRQFAYYDAPTVDTWDGYRFQANYSVPLGRAPLDGNLLYVGFLNYDFGSELGDRAGAFRTNEALVETNVLILSYTHLRYFLAARYFKNGGQWQDGAILDFGNGPQRLDENGWGYYLAIGWQF